MDTPLPLPGRAPSQQGQPLTLQPDTITNLTSVPPPPHHSFVLSILALSRPA